MTPQKSREAAPEKIHFLKRHAIFANPGRGGLCLKLLHLTRLHKPSTPEKRLKLPHPYRLHKPFTPDNPLKLPHPYRLHKPIFTRHTPETAHTRTACPKFKRKQEIYKGN